MSSDMEGICLLLLSLVCLTSANTQPGFTKFVYDVCEDVPVGGFAFNLLASDPENDPLTYQLSGPNAAFFSVEPNTGRVTVKRNLDRENDPVMQLTATVSDPYNSRTDTMSIILGDANDNRPLFRNPSYDTDIPENTPVGTTLFRMEATDADTSNAGVVTYTIDDVIPSEGKDLFSIVANTGVVTLTGRLNYTSLNTFYRLKITATDGGGKCHSPDLVYLSNVAFSLITVEDVADLDPIFIGANAASVEENSPLGEFVVKVTALDQDTGVADTIIYSIERSTAEGLFSISGNDGVVTVSSGIDRETVGDTVTLTVKATESNENIYGVNASATADYTITILDVNDNPPRLYKCEGSEAEAPCEEATDFTGEITEHRLGSVPIYMKVKDVDKSPRTQILLEGKDKDVFSVEPQETLMSESVIQLVVTNSVKLDYEITQQMVLEVVAIDLYSSTLRSTATVTINILDANDNSPTFPANTYNLTVAEHSPVGTTVANITADDLDALDEGKITYTLLPNSIRSIFDVEPNSGAIYVKNELLLDREAKSAHSMTLQARDTAGQVGTTVLEVTVTDINDQPPVMNRKSYLEYVKEGTQLNIIIEASDADEPDTVNSQIEYDILPGRYSDNFTIDKNTGELTNSADLDREALDPELDGRIELNVTATDKGTPPLSSVVTVTINVEDVNDNAPKFDAPLYKFSVKEGEKGAAVGSVYAKDLDQTINFNRVSFSIANGGFGSFIIRTNPDEAGYRGDITVDPDIELDYESDRNHFVLLVEAADLEQRKAEVTVEVKVLDVNDERPVFELTKPQTVKENSVGGVAVGSFKAIDRDGNHSLVYELEYVKCRCNNSLTPCDWFTLDPLGVVRVSPDHIVDYEQCDQAVVTAQVVDEYTEKGENNSATAGEMVINIEDTNDNTPEFIYSDSVFVVVSESASKGTSVAEVTAVDRDSGVNKQIEFKVTAVHVQDQNDQISPTRTLFEAVTTQQKDIYIGIIQTNEGLDVTLKGKYLVTVTATDPGGLSSTAVLDIFTVDESYKVELEFESSEMEVERKLTEIKRTLIAATKAAVEIVTIRSGTDESARASENTIVVAYFVYSNGTALTSTQVERMLSDPEYYPQLIQLGLKYIGQGVEEEPEANTLQYALMGMVGGLVIVLAVLTTSLMCTRRNYRRKLKAAKAMNSASMVNSGNQKGGQVVPGTNQYTMEGANPVLNLNINSAIALDLDEGSSDVDKVSVNSLDYNNGIILSEKGVKTNMLMVQEEEENEPPPEYIEPLGEALAQRGQKKKKTSDKPHMGVTNPAFDTTDL